MPINLIHTTQIPEHLLSSLERRDLALWVRNQPMEGLDLQAFVSFLGLPWKMVFFENNQPELISALETYGDLNPALVRKRGYFRVIDEDPSRIQFPQRCLPLFLLKGRSGSLQQGFAANFRRMAMAQHLALSAVPNLVILAGDQGPVPDELSDIWADGFRTNLTFCLNGFEQEPRLQEWIKSLPDRKPVTLLAKPLSDLLAETSEKYFKAFPDDRIFIRVKSAQNALIVVEVTNVDEPERPLLEHYEWIEERHLRPISTGEVTEADLNWFFENPSHSWRPYAAGIPWEKDSEARRKLERVLKTIENQGPQENCIASIAAEPGAGGTTLARSLAWSMAEKGYPVLVARQVSFSPDALAVGTFLTRIHREVERALPQPNVEEAPKASSKRSEVPVLIVFDALHWQGHDSEFLKFRNEFEKQGRRVCVLIVTDASPTLNMLTYRARFKEITTLTHSISRDEALLLGAHLNGFLKIHGREQSPSRWEEFYEEHSVQGIDNIASFWVTLSFWLQRQYDLNTTLQEWIYSRYKELFGGGPLRKAMVMVGALSSERLPMPVSLLPASNDRWPMSVLMDDRAPELGVLGMQSVRSNGEVHWAFIHDVLGRFLLNAIFYDHEMRTSLGYGEARTPEHMRFLVLREISANPALGELRYRALGEEFAQTIFKIDQDHGRASFLDFWPEVLNALDEMPWPLRDGSRAFRHHISVSRRRIAKLDGPFYGISNQEKRDLLLRAIEDITFALAIPFTAGAEGEQMLYNSLARGYFDLAEIEAKGGAENSRLAELRRLADDATRKAYRSTPDNSYVIETYVINLLTVGYEGADETANRCIEALSVLYSAITSNEIAYRKARLGTLADKALELLLNSIPKAKINDEPKVALDVLIRAWSALTEGRDTAAGTEFSDLPEVNRRNALKELEHPAGQGNLQILKFKYDILSQTDVWDFSTQLVLLEQLVMSDTSLTPQMKLEFAILLFQNERYLEGFREFKYLRRILRESDNFVHVPRRLQWLLSPVTKLVRTVSAKVGADGLRPTGLVREMANEGVIFRPEEFGLNNPTPGQQFTAVVFFSHNGPFLRPPSVAPAAPSMRD